MVVSQSELQGVSELIQLAPNRIVYHQVAGSDLDPAQE
jgi:hypothetical protein